jgi:hypothetical protein
LVTITPPGAGAAAVVVEGAAAQRRRQAVGVEAVHQQHVGAVVQLAHVVDRVGLDHAEAGVVARDGELLAQGDHLRIQFQHGDAAVRQIAVAELGQRAAAQADHDDVLGGWNSTKHIMARA